MNEYQTEIMRQKVKEALQRYQDGASDTSSGFNILRYARMGYLKEDVK